MTRSPGKDDEHQQTLATDNKAAIPPTVTICATRSARLRSARLRSARSQLWGSLLVLLVVVTPPVGGLTDTEGLREMGHWLDIPADVGSADAVVIMGGDSRRLAPGVALYQEGYAPEVWYTGSDVPSQRALRQIIRLGVPPAVTTHLEGSNTWEETQQIADTLTARDLHSVVIVTSWYHGRRAICTLRRHLQLLGDADSVTIYYQPVGYDAYGPDDWWISEAGRKAIFAELAKIGFYWFNYGLVLQGC